MLKHEKTWAAGILEGEGCFDYNRLPKYPRIRVEMTDHDVVLRLQEMLGGVVCLPRVRKRHWKPTMQLQINGSDAIKAMRAVRPWMGERRGAKIDELLANVKKV